MKIQQRSKIHIKRDRLTAWLATAVIMMPFAFALLQLAGLDDVVKLVMDCFWLSIAALPLLRGRLSISRKLLPFGVLTAVFAVDVLLVYLFRYQSGFYFLWGFRNNFRFYIVFFAVAACFREEDGSHCLRLFDRLFWVNALAVLVQFVLGYRQDFLGGMFGVSRGCNGYMIVYLTIVICKTILSYMNGDASTAGCFAKCVTALCISSVSELKFFFFLFLFILAMAMVLTSFSFRKVFLLGIGALLVSVAAIFLGSLYSGFEGFLSVDILIDALTRTNYATENDMGRFSAISQISRRFLTDPLSRLFGMGLGNCDSSGFSLFHTPFFTDYEYTHYHYFSHAFMFLENGYVGLALYVLFFIMCLAYAVKRLRSGGGDRLFCQMAVILSMVCFVMIFYNSALRTEAGYMIYFVLALPFIEQAAGMEKSKKEDM